VLRYSTTQFVHIGVPCLSCPNRHAPPSFDRFAFRICRLFRIPKQLYTFFALLVSSELLGKSSRPEHLHGTPSAPDSRHIGAPFRSFISIILPDGSPPALAPFGPGQQRPAASLPVIFGVAADHFCSWPRQKKMLLSPHDCSNDLHLFFSLSDESAPETRFR